MVSLGGYLDVNSAEAALILAFRRTYVHPSRKGYQGYHTCEKHVNFPGTEGTFNKFHLQTFCL